jgi:2-polyprenyl-3-methyl-5-hydroxy-6-metoxy-1,4-benzoquinol methylase
MVTSSKKEGDPKQSEGHFDFYIGAYGNFATELYAEIRAEAFGEDIGQQSWLSAEEQDRWLAWLELHQGSRLLDVACGSGGPTLRIAERTGCMVHGIDVEAKAISTAQELVRNRGLTGLAIFTVADANQRLDLAAESFDAIVCNDAISHLPDRSAVLAEWSRLLKPGGSGIFTDPLVVTGPLSSREIAVRSFNTFQLFVPRGFNESAIDSAGLLLVRVEDRTDNMAKFAARRRAARDARREALVKIEGQESVDRQNELFRVAAALASERRLSRFLFHVRKPN